MCNWQKSTKFIYIFFFLFCTITWFDFPLPFHFILSQTCFISIWNWRKKLWASSIKTLQNKFFKIQGLNLEKILKILSNCLRELNFPSFMDDPFEKSTNIDCNVWDFFFGNLLKLHFDASKLLKLIIRFSAKVDFLVMP